MQQKHSIGLRMMHWCSIRGWSWKSARTSCVAQW